MDCKLLSVFLIAVSASGALAIRCYVCAPTKVCQNNELGSLVTCPNFTGLVINQCAKFDGEFSGSVGDNKVSFNGLIRDCNAVPVNFAAPPNRCFSGDEATKYMRRLIEQVSSGAPSVGELTITINGDMCFCNEDGCNGVGSLQPFLAPILVLAFVQSALNM
ncbi:uncharacterized protein LOC110985027 [Acanthaster planci]|uniref:Uncharacterized protein LOC110985027 n=1 Tax=Acanthaster planci TaxID=133434 RepID=A0A8B7Z6Z2_ACAPL|nr:uncharacterized protein LOC110985027 [Acanthaster planci]